MSILKFSKMKLTAGVVSLVLGSFMLTTPASANSHYDDGCQRYRVGYSVGVLFGNSHYKRYHPVSFNAYTSYRSKRRGHSHSYGRSYSRGYDKRHSRTAHRSCRAVKKNGSWKGREALIGGRQCYDRYGNPYIVHGSRYVIKYYDSHEYH